MSDVRKNNLQQKNTPKIMQNDISDALLGEKTSKKQEINYSESQITGFSPSQKNYSSSTTADPRHGSIIRNITSASNSTLYKEMNTTWENCKYRKNSSGMDFCSEYHSLCAKEKCRRATQ